jgi:hypothetical protein
LHLSSEKPGFKMCLFEMQLAPLQCGANTRAEDAEVGLYRLDPVDP